MNQIIETTEKYRLGNSFNKYCKKNLKVLDNNNNNTLMVKI